MGMYEDVKEFLKFAVLLKEELARMTSNLKRVADKLDDLHSRVVRLEVRDEGHVNRTETTVQAAASSIVHKELGEIRERLAKIEMFLHSTTVMGNVPKSLEPPVKSGP
jgi:hypothetical protein